MALHIYNTLTRRKELFEPLEEGHVRMYVCGPTVYDKAHVGHAMSSLVFDIIRRYLEHLGYRVSFVMNYTDVDDKIIQRAQEAGIPPIELAEKYIQEYQQHLEDLNVEPATVNPRATQEMNIIIDMVQGLINSGYAYEVDGDVYFRVEADEDYGKLSGRHIEDMLAGSRVEVDQRKQNPMDFALWKSAKPGEPAWDSPWGKGRPGWHIECSAMNLNHLGEQIDIHGGGNDLIFPHHENEIAQTESFTGKPFAKYWVHNGMLQLSGEKMSKSIGNLITIQEFLDEHSGDVLRMVILNSSYRSPLTFNEDVISQAEKALERLRSALRPAMPNAKGASPEILDALQEQMIATREGFYETMDDDFNTAGALGHLFELVRTINHARDEGATPDELKSAQDQLRELTSILGLRLDDRTTKGSETSEALIDLLIEVRNQLREIKQWDLSDLIRDRLLELGIVLEDSKGETTWRYK
jgi:cysteinyl-tRNA synthetase